MTKTKGLREKIGEIYDEELLDESETRYLEDVKKTMVKKLLSLYKKSFLELVGSDTEPLTNYLKTTGKWRKENEEYHKAQNMLRAELREKVGKV